MTRTSARSSRLRLVSAALLLGAGSVLAGCGTANQSAGTSAAAEQAAQNPRAFFVAHAAEFAEVAALAEAGQLGVTGEWPPPYYGTELPDHLRSLSRTGKASDLCPDHAVGVFLPRWMGVPDDAAGYAYIGTQSPKEYGEVDLYGDPFEMEDAEPLGDGWYWVGRVSSARGSQAARPATPAPAAETHARQQP